MVESEVSLSLSVVHSSCPSQGTEKALNILCAFCPKENPTVCSHSDTPAPTFTGTHEPPENEGGGHWLWIKLVFQHEPFICVVFQTNTSVISKERLCLLTRVGIAPSLNQISTANLPQLLPSRPNRGLVTPFKLACPHIPLGRASPEGFSWPSLCPLGTKTANARGWPSGTGNLHNKEEKIKSQRTV